MGFVLTSGFLFGLIMVFAGLNKYETITGAALLKNFTVPKTLLISIGLGLLVLSIFINLGWANYHVKPFVVTGVIVGGLLFGAGMAILGYCPGTLAISLGEGSLDAAAGIVGGLFSGMLFSVLYPNISTLLGPDFGKISLQSLMGGSTVLFYILVLIIGFVLIYLSFLLNKKDKNVNYKWLISGILLAVLNVVVFLKFTANRPIGASTTYPYLGDLLTGFNENSYFNKIKIPGHWELIFLTGSFFAAFLYSLITKEFGFRITYPTWEKYKGTSKIRRILWAFTGGFILIFGARMAGGCTSGHILSGGMQLALSSYVFAVFVGVGFLIAGKIFYKKINS